MTSSVTKITNTLLWRIRVLFAVLLLAILLGYFLIPFGTLTAETKWRLLSLDMANFFVLFTLTGLFLAYRRIVVRIRHLLAVAMSQRQALEQKIDTLQQALQQAEQGESRFEQRIRQRALLDIDTGIGNREYFSNRLDALLCEPDCQGAVLLIHFNEMACAPESGAASAAVNLIRVAIDSITPKLTSFPGYFMARQSELELALLLPECFAEQAQKLADNLLWALTTMAQVNGIHSEQLVHIGISCVQQQPAYQIMAEADMALRTAQLQGPSQWFMLDGKELAQTTVRGSLQWRTLLLWAIAQQRIETFFQPVLARDTGEILHVETLAKLKDKHGQYIRAGIFLPMAQKCGLALQIDLLMFKQVWQQLNTQRSSVQRLSVNLSVEFLMSAANRQNMLQSLQAQPELAQRLIIELSEYHLVQHWAALLPALRQVHATGVQLLADRVGQYVVNAGYLTAGLISALKLHRSIVLNIAQKPENQVFIQSIKTLCEAQQVAVYALGVETFDEWQTLQRLGIDGGQGYLFTTPDIQQQQDKKLYSPPVRL